MANNGRVEVEAIIADNLNTALSSLSSNLRSVIANINQLNKQSVKSENTMASLNRVLQKGSDASSTYRRRSNELISNQATLARYFKTVDGALVELQSRMNAAGNAQSRYSSGTRDLVSALNSQKQAQKQLSDLVRRQDLQKQGAALTALADKYSMAAFRMSLAVTMPLAQLARGAFSNYRRLETETVRTSKLLSDSFTDVDAALKILGEELDSVSLKYGVARERVQALAGDYAELGINSIDAIAGLTDLTAAVEKLGNVDLEESQSFIKAIYQNILRIKRDRGELIQSEEDYAEVIGEVRGQLAMFNLVENKTALSLKELAKGFPELSAAATSFGLSMTEAAGMLAPMISGGFQLGASANSIKVSLQRLVAMPKLNVEMLKSLNEELDGFNVKAGVGIQNIQLYADAFNKLKDSKGEQGALEFFARMFGVRQGTRMLVSLQNLAQFQQQLSDTVNKTEEADLSKKLEGYVNSRINELGGMYKTIQVKKFEDLGQIVRISQRGDDAYAKAMLKGREDFGAYLAAEAKAGRDRLGKIQTESGRAFFIGVAGGAEGSEAQRKYAEEVEKSLDTAETRYQRAREMFKEIGRQLVPIFADILKAITPILAFITNMLKKMSPATKAMISIGLIALAMVGPFMKMKSAFYQMMAGVAGLKAMNPFGRLKRQSIEISEEIVRSNEQLFKMQGGLTQFGNKFYLSATIKEFKKLQEAMALSSSPSARKRAKAERIYKDLGIDKTTPADFSGLMPGTRESVEQSLRDLKGWHPPMAAGMAGSVADYSQVLGEYAQLFLTAGGTISAKIMEETTAIGSGIAFALLETLRIAGFDVSGVVPKSTTPDDSATTGRLRTGRPRGTVVTDGDGPDDGGPDGGTPSGGGPSGGRPSGGRPSGGRPSGGSGAGATTPVTLTPVTPEPTATEPTEATKPKAVVKRRGKALLSTKDLIALAQEPVEEVLRKVQLDQLKLLVTMKVPAAQFKGLKVGQIIKKIIKLATDPIKLAEEEIDALNQEILAKAGKTTRGPTGRTKKASSAGTEAVLEEHDKATESSVEAKTKEDIDSIKPSGSKGKAKASKTKKAAVESTDKVLEQVDKNNSEAIGKSSSKVVKASRSSIKDLPNKLKNILDTLNKELEEYPVEIQSLLDAVNAAIASGAPESEVISIFQSFRDSIISPLQTMQDKTRAASKEASAIVAKASVEYIKAVVDSVAQIFKGKIRGVASAEIERKIPQMRDAFKQRVISKEERGLRSERDRIAEEKKQEEKNLARLRVQLDNYASDAPERVNIENQINEKENIIENITISIRNIDKKISNLIDQSNTKGKEAVKKLFRLLANLQSGQTTPESFLQQIKSNEVLSLISYDDIFKILQLQIKKQMEMVQDELKAAPNSKRLQNELERLEQGLQGLKGTSEALQDAIGTIPADILETSNSAFRRLIRIQNSIPALFGQNRSFGGQVQEMEGEIQSLDEGLFGSDEGRKGVGIGSLIGQDDSGYGGLISASTRASRMVTDILATAGKSEDPESYLKEAIDELIKKKLMFENQFDKLKEDITNDNQAEIESVGSDIQDLELAIKELLAMGAGQETSFGFSGTSIFDELLLLKEKISQQKTLLPTLLEQINAQKLDLSEFTKTDNIDELIANLAAELGAKNAQEIEAVEEALINQSNSEEFINLTNNLADARSELDAFNRENEGKSSAELTKRLKELETKVDNAKRAIDSVRIVVPEELSDDQLFEMAKQIIDETIKEKQNNIIKLETKYSEANRALASMIKKESSLTERVSASIQGLPAVLELLPAGALEEKMAQDAKDRIDHIFKAAAAQREAEAKLLEIRKTGLGSAVLGESYEQLYARASKILEKEREATGIERDLKSKINKLKQQLEKTPNDEKLQTKLDIAENDLRELTYRFTRFGEQKKLLANLVAAQFPDKKLFASDKMKSLVPLEIVGRAPLSNLLETAQENMIQISNGISTIIGSTLEDAKALGFSTISAVSGADLGLTREGADKGQQRLRLTGAVFKNIGQKLGIVVPHLYDQIADILASTDVVFGSAEEAFSFVSGLLQTVQIKQNSKLAQTGDYGSIVGEKILVLDRIAKMVDINALDKTLFSGLSGIDGRDFKTPKASLASIIKTIAQQKQPEETIAQQVEKNQSQIKKTIKDNVELLLSTDDEVNGFMTIFLEQRLLRFREMFRLIDLQIAEKILKDKGGTKDAELRKLENQIQDLKNQKRKLTKQGVIESDERVIKINETIQELEKTKVLLQEAIKTHLDRVQAEIESIDERLKNITDVVRSNRGRIREAVNIRRRAANQPEVGGFDKKTGQRIPYSIQEQLQQGYLTEGERLQIKEPNPYLRTRPTKISADASSARKRILEILRNNIDVIKESSDKAALNNIKQQIQSEKQIISTFIQDKNSALMLISQRIQERVEALKAVEPSLRTAYDQRRIRDFEKIKQEVVAIAKKAIEEGATEEEAAQIARNALARRALAFEEMEQMLLINLKEFFEQVEQETAKLAALLPGEDLGARYLGDLKLDQFVDNARRNLRSLSAAANPFDSDEVGINNNIVRQIMTKLYESMGKPAHEIEKAVQGYMSTLIKSRERIANIAKATVGDVMDEMDELTNALSTVGLTIEEVFRNPVEAWEKMRTQQFGKLANKSEFVELFRTLVLFARDTANKTVDEVVQSTIGRLQDIKPAGGSSKPAAVSERKGLFPDLANDRAKLRAAVKGLVSEIEEVGMSAMILSTATLKELQYMGEFMFGDAKDELGRKIASRGSMDTLGKAAAVIGKKYPDVYATPLSAYKTITAPSQAEVAEPTRGKSIDEIRKEKAILDAQKFSEEIIKAISSATSESDISEIEAKIKQEYDRFKKEYKKSLYVIAKEIGHDIKGLLKSAKANVSDLKAVQELNKGIQLLEDTVIGGELDDLVKLRERFEALPQELIQNLDKILNEISEGLTFDDLRAKIAFKTNPEQTLAILQQLKDRVNNVVRPTTPAITTPTPAVEEKTETAVIKEDLEKIDEAVVEHIVETSRELEETASEIKAVPPVSLTPIMDKIKAVVHGQGDFFGNYIDITDITALQLMLRQLSGDFVDREHFIRTVKSLIRHLKNIETTFNVSMFDLADEMGFNLQHLLMEIKDTIVQTKTEISTATSTATAEPEAQIKQNADKLIQSIIWLLSSIQRMTSDQLNEMLLMLGSIPTGFEQAFDSMGLPIAEMMKTVVEEMERTGRETGVIISSKFNRWFDFINQTVRQAAIDEANVIGVVRTKPAIAFPDATDIFARITSSATPPPAVPSVDFINELENITKFVDSGLRVGLDEASSSIKVLMDNIDFLPEDVLNKLLLLVEEIAFDPLSYTQVTDNIGQNIQEIFVIIQKKINEIKTRAAGAVPHPATTAPATSGGAGAGSGAAGGATPPPPPPSGGSTPPPPPGGSATPPPPPPPASRTVPQKAISGVFELTKALIKFEVGVARAVSKFVPFSGTLFKAIDGVASTFSKAAANVKTLDKDVSLFSVKGLRMFSKEIGKLSSQQIGSIAGGFGKKIGQITGRASGGLTRGFANQASMGLGSAANMAFNNMGMAGMIGGNILQNMISGLSRIPIVGTPAVIVLTAITGAIGILFKTQKEWSSKSPQTLQNFKDAWVSIKEAIGAIISPIEDFFGVLIGGTDTATSGTEKVTSGLERFSEVFKKYSKIISDFIVQKIAPAIRFILGVVMYVYQTIAPVVSTLIQAMSAQILKWSLQNDKIIDSASGKWGKYATDAQYAASEQARANEKASVESASAWERFRNASKEAGKKFVALWKNLVIYVQLTLMKWVNTGLVYIGKQIIKLFIEAGFAAGKVFSSGFLQAIPGGKLGGAIKKALGITKALIMREPVTLMDILRGKEDKSVSSWVKNALKDVTDFTFESIGDGMNAGLDLAIAAAGGKTRDSFFAMIKGLIPAGAGAGLGKAFAKLIKEAFNNPESADAVGESINSMKKQIEDGIKNLQKDFVNQAISEMGNAISKMSSELSKRLNEQKDNYLKAYDDQIAGINALAEAEERLTATEQYESDRRKRIRDRDLQSSNYNVDRAVAIYEGRVDDARRLDLEERANATAFNEDISNMDRERQKTLRAQNRADAITIIQNQKEEASKLFEEAIKDFEDFVADVTKNGTLSQEEFSKQWKIISEKAQATASGVESSFKTSLEALPQKIKDGMDPITADAGYFSTGMDSLIATAKSKFGLDTKNSAGDSESILGLTKGMLSGQSGMTSIVSEAFSVGGVIQTAYGTGYNNLVSYIKDKNNPDSENSIASAFKDAMEKANKAMDAEFRKNNLVGSIKDLIKEMNGEWKKLAIAEITKNALADASKEVKDAINGLTKGSGGASGGKGTTDKDGDEQRVTYWYRKKGTGIYGWRSVSETSVDKYAGNKDYDVTSTLNGRVPNAFFKGGAMPYSSGGPTFGPMHQGIPAILHGGEYVVRKSAVDKYGSGMLQSINQGTYNKTKGFFNGGMIPYKKGGVVNKKSGVVNKKINKTTTQEDSNVGSGFDPDISGFSNSMANYADPLWFPVSADTKPAGILGTFAEAIPFYTDAREKQEMERKKKRILFNIVKTINDFGLPPDYYLGNKNSITTFSDKDYKYLVTDFKNNRSLNKNVDLRQTAFIRLKKNSSEKVVNYYKDLILQQIADAKILENYRKYYNAQPTQLVSKLDPSPSKDYLLNANIQSSAQSFINLATNKMFDTFKVNFIEPFDPKNLQQKFIKDANFRALPMNTESWMQYSATELESGAKLSANQIKTMLGFKNLIFKKHAYGSGKNFIQNLYKPNQIKTQKEITISPDEHDPEYQPDNYLAYNKPNLRSAVFYKNMWFGDAGAVEQNYNNGNYHNADKQYWAGVFGHEIGHSFGMGHPDEVLSRVRVPIKTPSDLISKFQDAKDFTRYLKTSLESYFYMPRGEIMLPYSSEDSLMAYSNRTNKFGIGDIAYYQRLLKTIKQRTSKPAIQKKFNGGLIPDGGQNKSIKKMGIPQEEEQLLNMGRLEIPKRGVSGTVFHGLSDTAFDKGFGHWPNTPFGGFGNTVIGGHRSKGWAPFKFIDKFQIGDAVNLFSQDGLLNSYSIFKKQIVNPQDTWIAKQDLKEKILTMFSCHPYGKVDKRYIVSAKEMIKRQAPKRFGKIGKYAEGGLVKGVTDVRPGCFACAFGLRHSTHNELNKYWDIKDTPLDPKLSEYTVPYTDMSIIADSVDRANYEILKGVFTFLPQYGPHRFGWYKKSALKNGVVDTLEYDPKSMSLSDLSIEDIMDIDYKGSKVLTLGHPKFVKDYFTVKDNPNDFSQYIPVSKEEMLLNNAEKMPFIQLKPSTPKNIIEKYKQIIWSLIQKEIKIEKYRDYFDKEQRGKSGATSYKYAMDYDPSPSKTSVTQLDRAIFGWMKSDGSGIVDGLKVNFFNGKNEKTRHPEVYAGIAEAARNIATLLGIKKTSITPINSGTYPNSVLPNETQIDMGSSPFGVNEETGEAIGAKAEIGDRRRYRITYNSDLAEVKEKWKLSKEKWRKLLVHEIFHNLGAGHTSTNKNLLDKSGRDVATPYNPYDSIMSYYSNFGIGDIAFAQEFLKRIKNQVKEKTPPTTSVPKSTTTTTIPRPTTTTTIPKSTTTTIPRPSTTTTTIPRPTTTTVPKTTTTTTIPRPTTTIPTPPNRGGQSGTRPPIPFPIPPKRGGQSAIPPKLPLPVCKTIKTPVWVPGTPPEYKVTPGAKKADPDADWPSQTFDGFKQALWIRGKKGKDKWGYWKQAPNNPKQYKKFKADLKKVYDVFQSTLYNKPGDPNTEQWHQDNFPIFGKTKTYGIGLAPVPGTPGKWIDKLITTCKPEDIIPEIPPTMFKGGLLRPFYKGGKTGGTSDKAVPAILHGGEYVINKRSVDKYGTQMLQNINQGIYKGARQYKIGGYVSSIKTPEIPKYNIPATTYAKISSQSPSTGTIQSESTHNYNFYVDNFIGESEWFNSMMKEYNIKVVPTKQKQAGLETRVIKTYNGINRGM